MGRQTSIRGRHRVNIDTFKPLLRAYALGYLTATGPRLLSALRIFRRKDLSIQDKVQIFLTILRTSLQINRFPTACAVIIGGTTALPCITLLFLSRLVRVFQTQPKIFNFSDRSIKRIQISCTFLSALLAFNLLNKDEEWTRRRTVSRSANDPKGLTIDPPNKHHLPPPSYHPRYAGKTVDFTLFALTRALDVISISLWNRKRLPQTRPNLTKHLSKSLDPIIFSASAATIMWAWFYTPDRLPRAYNHWISRIAQIDNRLIQVLRQARQGNFIYGQDTGQAPVLRSLCKELNLPEKYGDPAITIPIPCELYHCGRGGTSCELHAISRFKSSFQFALFRLYLPLNLLTILRPILLRNESQIGKKIIQSLKSSLRSSTFLASFVSFFYYAVCLSRTKLGPKFIPNPQMWDSGLCILAGCWACGWSIFIEGPASKRQEMAFFVAPRTLATLLPRVYNGNKKVNVLREQFVFASCVTVVLMSSLEGKGRVRGVLGRILGTVLA